MLNLKIYNTLTGKKDLFRPIKNKRVNIFVCGPTIYDYSHIGHARLFVTFDAFVKYLRQSGFNVFYLQNITDLDDKIIARAREKKVSPKDLADAFTKEYYKDIKSLGVDSVSKYAPATKYIKEIISQVKRLEQRGFAYKIENDGVYYDISKFKDYGKLAGRTMLDAEDAVTRIDYSKDKKNRGDFCLWKFKQEDFEPSWPSPWGRGRPGWHIEDTAIAEKFFGPQYDIHGGARELLFPHHQAEVSQMEAISGKSPMVKYWMHVGVLTVSGQKMSKSLGNFIVISDFLRRYSVQQLRFLVTKNLWSSPLDYSDSAMIEVKSALEKIEDFLRKIRNPNIKIQNKSKIQISKILKNAEENFYAELADNFNTPKAFAVLFDFIRDANKILEAGQIKKQDAQKIYKFFEEINQIFGIIDFKKVNAKIPAKIKRLVLKREKFRQEKNWQKSDELRAQIEKQGYSVEDTPSGPSLKKI